MLAGRPVGSPAFHDVQRYRLYSSTRHRLLSTLVLTFSSVSFWLSALPARGCLLNFIAIMAEPTLCSLSPRSDGRSPGELRPMRFKTISRHTPPTPCPRHPNRSLAPHAHQSSDCPLVPSYALEGMGWRSKTKAISPHPHLQTRHRGPDVALGPVRDLAGDGDGSAPPPGEEGRENLVFRRLEPDRLEAGLEAFGQAGNVQVGGTEERMAGFHPVEVGEEHVLSVLGATVQFVHHHDRPLAEDGGVGE